MSETYLLWICIGVWTLVGMKAGEKWPFRTEKR
jgi:hypothetical protein